MLNKSSPPCRLHDENHLLNAFFLLLFFVSFFKNTVYWYIYSNMKCLLLLGGLDREVIVEYFKVFPRLEGIILCFKHYMSDFYIFHFYMKIE